MLRRTLIAGFLAAAAAVSLAGTKPEMPPVPAVLQPNEQELKQVTEDAQKAVAEKNDELLAKAIEEMETLRHESFVPYIRSGLKSGDTGVLAASLRAAASQDMKDVEKDVRKLLHTKPSKKDGTGLSGEVGAAAIDYLIRLDVTGEESAVLDDFLTPLLADERRVKASWGVDLMRASLHYLGKAKAKRAVPLLIELVPEPQPKNPNDPKNPPATYWQERVKLWHKSEGWARWALKEITTKEFRSYREWEAWLKENKKDFK
jgi:hypothetical protein